MLVYKQNTRLNYYFYETREKEEDIMRKSRRYAITYIQDGWNINTGGKKHVYMMADVTIVVCILYTSCWLMRCYRKTSISPLCFDTGPLEQFRKYYTETCDSRFCT